MTRLDSEPSNGPDHGLAACFPVDEGVVRDTLGLFTSPNVSAAHEQAAQFIRDENRVLATTISRLHDRWRLSDEEQRMFNGGVDIGYSLLRTQARRNQTTVPRVGWLAVGGFGLAARGVSFRKVSAYAEKQLGQIRQEDRAYHEVVAYMVHDMRPRIGPDCTTAYMVGSVLVYEMVRRGNIHPDRGAKAGQLRIHEG